MRSTTFKRRNGKITEVIETTYRCKYCESENIYTIAKTGGEKLGYIHNFITTPVYTIVACEDCGKVTKISMEDYE